MKGWWLASYVVLWTLLMSTIFVLLVVLRQLGLIYVRVRGGGVQLQEGPPIGADIPPFDEVEDETGAEYRFPEPLARLSVLIFASPHCEICKDALRGLRAAARGYDDVNMVVISEGRREDNRELRSMVSEAVHFTTSTRRQRQFNVETLPYALVTNGDGRVLQKAVINDLDDLEEMLDQATSDAIEPQEAMQALQEGR